MIIGVTGYRRCGKDSTCKILVERFGFKQYGFADALRALALELNPGIKLLGAPREILRDLGCSERAWLGYRDIVDEISYDRAKDIPDFRQFLQRLGTEGIRNVFGPDAWINALALRIDADASPLVCISDVRFHNEVAWLNARNGLVWRVERPGYGGDDPHPSEAAIPHLEAHYELSASNLTELEQQVLSLANYVGLSVQPPTVPSDASSSSTSASSTDDQAGGNTGTITRAP